MKPWHMAVILAAAGGLAGGAQAQGSVDPALLAQGAEVYAAQCAICHKEDGRGYPPRIPALVGSLNVEDPYVLVQNVHLGGAEMPPVPTLSDAEIAAVATYVRNSFDHAFGAVTPEEVAALKEEIGPAEAPAPRSIWDGVYTQAQADQGQMLARGPCGLCHGSRLNGVPDDQDQRPAPPLARANFLRSWEGRSLGSLYGYSRATMPQSNPGFLPDEDYVAIIAYMLSLTGAPAGDTPLPVDLHELAHIAITMEN